MYAFECKCIRQMHCMRYVCCARRAALLECIRMCMYVSEFNLRCVCALYVNVCNTMYSFRIQLLRMHSYRLRMQQYVLVLNFRANYTCNSRKLHISRGHAPNTTVLAQFVATDRTRATMISPWHALRAQTLSRTIGRPGDGSTISKASRLHLN